MTYLYLLLITDQFNNSILMDAETKRKTNAPRVHNTRVYTGQLSRAGQCWQGWAQWTPVTMTRLAPRSPDHLLALVPTLLTSHTLHRVLDPAVVQWSPRPVSP